VKTLVSLLLLVPALAAADKSYVDGKGATWDCAKDPVVSILANQGVYTLKGTCKSVSIDGNENKVTIEGSAKLSVNGNKNAVDAASIDAISTNGNENAVSVKKAGAKVSNPGTSNKITTGDAKAATKPAPSSAPSGDAITIDCAKQPTYTITNGDGTYTFTGTCTKISIAGGENHLTVENVKELVVAGSENVVTIGGVDKIGNAGSDNKVTYKKGLTGAKPKITSVGQRTTVEQIK
jgi:hypothetical protein